MKSEGTSADRARIESASEGHFEELLCNKRPNYKRNLFVQNQNSRIVTIQNILTKYNIIET